MEVYYTKPRNKLLLSAYAGQHEGPPAYLLSYPPTNLLKIDVGDATKLSFLIDICPRVLRVGVHYTFSNTACLPPYLRSSQRSA
jgi:hypothetical protein